MSETTFMEHFISAEKLPSSYIKLAENHYLPILNKLAQHHKTQKKQLVIGINGCQGSGKSTVSELFVQALSALHNLKAYCLSIDDFYLPKSARNQLAESIHPLLATRGVPGTHDTQLAHQVLEALANKATVQIPRFNKAIDDRHSPEQFTTAAEPADVVILEGWCVGATPQAEHLLGPAINELEAQQDPNGDWRAYVNQCLASDYQALFDRIDCMLMLKAPSFDCVFQWRLQQEQKLAQRLSDSDDRSGVMSPEQVKQFIQFYQRLTEHQLQHLPTDCHFLVELDSDRNVKNSSMVKPL